MGNEVTICHFYLIFGISNGASTFSVFKVNVVLFYNPHPHTHYPVYSMGIVAVQEDS